MAVHSFVRLMDEAPLGIIPPVDLNIDAGYLQASSVISAQFELEIPAGALQGTAVLIGNSQIDIMVYVAPLIGHTELKGQYFAANAYALPLIGRAQLQGFASMGATTIIDAGMLQGTGILRGLYSNGDSEVDPLQAITVLRGRVRIAPASTIPYFHIELRDSNGILQHVFAKNVTSLRWDTEPRHGGCKSAAFALIDPTLSLDESVLAEYDMRIMLDTGSGIDVWWRGYLLNPRLILGEPYRMEFSALGWAQRLDSEAVVGLGFKVEDGGIRFDNMDAAAIARTLIDRANVAGAGITYSAASAPDSGYLVTSIQFNSSILDALKLLGELAGEAEWGVNRRKEFYFRQSTTSVDQVFFIGKDLEEMIHDFDHDGIVNRLYLFGTNGARWAIEDNASLTADISQTLSDATLAFGKATSNQRLVQTFTSTRHSLSAIDLKIAKIGWGAELMIDGDMELDDGSAPANWLKLKVRTKRRKLATGAHAGTRCLEVRHNQTGKGKYGVYQDVAVTANQEVQFSCWLRDPEKEDVVIVDLLDGTAAPPMKDSDPIIVRIQNLSRNLTWHRVSGQVTPTGTILGVRIWTQNRIGGTGSDPFYIDDVRLQEASDLSISVVERISTTPLAFDEENPLATGEIFFDDIPDTTPAVLRIYRIASPLDSAKTYGILIDARGELSDSHYFLLAYQTTLSGLSKDDGVGFGANVGGAYHIISLPSGQISQGVRSLTLDKPQIDNDLDAIVYGASFLASRSTPKERGSVRLKPNRNVLIEESQPIDLVRVARGK